MMGSDVIARRLGTSRATVNVLSNAGTKAVILGRGLHPQGEERAVVVVSGTSVDVKAASAAPIIAAGLDEIPAERVEGVIDRALADPAVDRGAGPAS